MNLRPIHVFWFSSVLCLFGGVIAADEAARPTAQVVEELLEVGWGKPPAALSRAQEIYGFEAADVPGRGKWLHYAFALVNVKHRQYADAVKLLDKAIKLEEGFLPAHEAKIWLLIQLKKQETAVEQMERTAEVAGQAQQAAGVTPKLRETAAYLGRVFGYLSGPVKGAVAEPRLDEAREAIDEHLGESLAADFAAGAKEVDDQFTELFLAKEQTRDDAKQLEDEFKQSERERLEKEKGGVSERQGEIDETVSKLREEIDARLAEIDKKIEPLDQTLANLNAQGAQVNASLAANEREIARWLDLADSTDDPVLQLRYRSEADRLSAISVRLDRDLATLESQARRVQGELAALAGQRNAAIGRFEAEMKRLGREAGDLRKQARRIDKESQSAAKPSSGNVAAVRSLQAKAKSLTTYQPFPLEREKERVLEGVLQPSP